MLPLVGEGPVERADAARNRQRILDAAARLIARDSGARLMAAGVGDPGAEEAAGAAVVPGFGVPTMDEIAAEAGVGVGTIYRRFGGRAGLAHALLDAREKEFQGAFMSGPPPLGPGASARERVRAFLRGYADRLVEEAPLLLAAETNAPLARFHNGAYELHRAHLAGLIAEERPGVDAEVMADALLAPLAANLYFHQRARGVGHERIRAGLDALMDGWAALERAGP